MPSTARLTVPQTRFLLEARRDAHYQSWRNILVPQSQDSTLVRRADPSPCSTAIRVQFQRTAQGLNARLFSVLNTFMRSRSFGYDVTAIPSARPAGISIIVATTEAGTGQTSTILVDAAGVVFFFGSAMEYHGCGRLMPSREDGRRIGGRIPGEIVEFRSCKCRRARALPLHVPEPAPVESIRVLFAGHMDLKPLPRLANASGALSACRPAAEWVTAREKPGAPGLEYVHL
jgi:hypothetical protein